MDDRMASRQIEGNSYNPEWLKNTAAAFFAAADGFSVCDLAAYSP
jgi:hypothetical protein